MVLTKFRLAVCLGSGLSGDVVILVEPVAGVLIYIPEQDLRSPRVRRWRFGNDYRRSGRTMKFDELYPDAQPDIAPEKNILLAQHSHGQACVVCGEFTRWFHREMIAHLCSEECVSAHVELKWSGPSGA